MKSPVVLLRSLLQDTARLLPGVKGLDRDLSTIEHRLKHEGYGFLTITLPTLCDSLDQGLASGKFTCPRNFNTVPGGRIPRFLSGIFCEVFDVVTGNLIHSDSTVEFVKILREILRMFKKLALDSSQEETLDQLARKSFFELEDSLSHQSFDDREAYIFKRVTQYILPNLDTFRDEDLHCKHGPGAVHEGVIGNQKWNLLLDHLDQVDLEAYDYHSWSSSATGRRFINSSLRSSAKLITVPKNSTSRRTITVEPLLKQFLQQGLNTYLRDEILKCSILRNSLSLTDQSENQKLALEGSQTDEWATIDLSSASDSISLRIVETLFERHPRFLSRLINGRSQSVLSHNCERDLKKFAGMGNATTFPVQSVLFAVLAICAICSDKEITYGRVRRASRVVRVYGDDIIVPVQHARSVVDWITKAGLTVNLRKSFLNGPFKESCGTDAYRGYDVTPLYVRYHPINASKREPSVLAHYVSLCNQAWMRGLYALSATLQEIIERGLGKPLPLVTQRSSVLGLHSRQDTFSVHRWNGKLHRFELRGECLLPKFRKDALDGYGALLKYFHSPFQEDVSHLERTPVRFRNRIVQRWVAS